MLPSRSSVCVARLDGSHLHPFLADSMETLDDLDAQHAASISGEALRLMTELGIPVIPSNFTVWFAYVLGRSPALRKMIDILRSNKRPFDRAVNSESLQHVSTHG